MSSAPTSREAPRTRPPPFYLYIDEFQRFVTPTIAENLDEARGFGFGLHLTLAHQYPSQLIEASRDYGQRLYESVMENARSKVVFSLSLRGAEPCPPRGLALLRHL
jgi:hypothetical protein